MSEENQEPQYLWDIQIVHHHGEETVPFGLTDDCFEEGVDRAGRHILSDIGMVKIREAMSSLTRQGYFKNTETWGYEYIPAASITRVTWETRGERRLADD